MNDHTGTLVIDRLVCVSACLSVCLYACLCSCMLVCLSTRLSVLSASQSICPAVYLSSCLSAYLSIGLVCVCVCQIYPPVFLDSHTARTTHRPTLIQKQLSIFIHNHSHSPIHTITHAHIRVRARNATQRIFPKCLGFFRLSSSQMPARCLQGKCWRDTLTNLVRWPRHWPCMLELNC